MDAARSAHVSDTTISLQLICLRVSGLGAQVWITEQRIVDSVSEIRYAYRQSKLDNLFLRKVLPQVL
jgi:hypothetical protein